MDKIILILVLLAVAAIGINAIVPNPEEVARGYKTEQQANAAATMSAIQADEANQLVALNVETANAAKNEKIAAQKISIWGAAYGKTALIIAGTSAAGGLSVAFVIIALNLAVAYSRRAHYIVKMTYPNHAGQLPVMELPAGQKRTLVSLANHATFGNDRSDERHEPVVQLADNSARVQQAYFAATIAAKQKAGGHMAVSEFLDIVNREAQARINAPKN